MIKTQEYMSSIMKHVVMKFSSEYNWKKPDTYIGC